MIIRSPKWLRKVFDFEIILGNDLRAEVKALKLYPELKFIENKLLVEQVLSKVIKEHKLYPFIDKLNIVRDDKNLYHVKYFFENGEKILLIIYDDSKFYIKANDIGVTLLDKDYLSKLIKLFNSLRDNSLNRITEKEKVKKPIEAKSTGNTVKDKYNLIVRKIKLRAEEINKLPKDSPQRDGLINELNSYKRVADKLKKTF